MMSPGVRSKVEQVEVEEKKVVVTKKREEEEKREVVLQPLPSTQGKLATIQPLPPRPQPHNLLSISSVVQQGNATLVTNNISNSTLAATSILPNMNRQQVSRLASTSEGADQQQGGALQKLHAALALSNPAYKPPGFTITSLSECSEGVLRVNNTSTSVGFVGFIRIKIGSSFAHSV